MLDLIFGRRRKLAGARRLIDEGALLLDVRSESEFAERHIRGALNIPVQSLAQRLQELPAKEHPIVVHCRSGIRSATAADLLRKAGWSHVHDIGGYPPW
jgi:phage shock protein E